jgi:hypothetical protein
MKTVVLDSGLRAKLFDLTHSLELRDETGRVLGYFAPVVSKEPNPDEGLEIPFSEEEIREFMQQTGGRPLADILADLEKLA